MTILLPNKNAKSRVSKKNRGASIRPEGKNNNENMYSFKRAIKIFSTFIWIGVILLAVDNISKIYLDINAKKIEHVVVDGSLDYLSKTELENVVLGFMNERLVAVDLDKIKAEVEKNPWVKAVDVRREWPDTIVITVSEEVAIARWGENGLLSQQGEIFSPKGKISQIGLPHLSGPESTERKVMEEYQKINQILFPEGLRVASLELNSRNAWAIDLTNGVKIKVGTNNVLEKLRRLVGVIDYLLIDEMASIESIDLRYTNGIAISRKDSPNEDMVSL